MADSAPTLDQAVAMSRELGRLAEAADWTAFKERQDARDAALNALFQRAPEDESSRQRLIQGIREILALDRQTLPLLQAARDASGRAAGRTRKDHASLAAYQRVASQRD